jgi:hypothetical protein
MIPHSVDAVIWLRIGFAEKFRKVLAGFWILINPATGARRPASHNHQAKHARTERPSLTEIGEGPNFTDHSGRAMLCS